MGEQVLDLDLSTSSLFVSTLYKRFFFSNQAPLLQIRGQMWLSHGCTILGYFYNGCDWPPPFGDELMVGRCVIALGCSGFSDDGDDVVQRNVAQQGWQ